MLKKLKGSVSRAIQKFKNGSRDSHSQNKNSAEIVFADFDSFQKISLIPNYKKGITPYLFVILKHKKEILENLVKKFNEEFGLIPKIGVELEFYLKKGCIKKHSIKKVLSLILSECKKSGIKILDLEEEKGSSQFEIKTYPESDLLVLAKNLEKIKKIIKKSAKEHEYKASFDALPYINDCGSALQLNISLHNKDGNGDNIFTRKFESGEFLETKEIEHCIGGLCDFLSEYSVFFSQNQDDFVRYDTYTNKQLHKKGKFVSPTNISWGVNNRTTAIRIPSPKFSSVKEYEEVDESRRIENRVPCADCDIYLAIIGSILGVYLGLKNKTNPPEKTFENAYDIKEFEKIEYKTIRDSKIFELLFS